MGVHKLHVVFLPAETTQSESLVYHLWIGTIVIIITIVNQSIDLNFNIPAVPKALSGLMFASNCPD